jgi:hypothetical protein
MEHEVTFAPEKAPSWASVLEYLTKLGYLVQTRMIDGELAFPDEAPPETWRELRVGTPGGMVTLLREEGRIRLVVWGNADANLRAAWNALAWAYAELTGGRVAGAGRSLSSAEFRQEAELPEQLRAT